MTSGESKKPEYMNADDIEPGAVVRGKNGEALINVFSIQRRDNKIFFYDSFGYWLAVDQGCQMIRFHPATTWQPV